MIQMPREMEFYKYVGKDEKRYLRSEAAAAFLGASLKFYSETSRRVFVTQFSTATGGHSSHTKGGYGDFIDILYVNKNINIVETVWTFDKNKFDFEKSSLLIKSFKLFGYNNQKPNSILTENPNKTGPMFQGTGWDPGSKERPLDHRNHFHLQRFNLSHIEDGSK